MPARQIFIVFGCTLAMVFGAVALWNSPSTPPPRFEAHEYALFREEYETLRLQNAQRRVRHFERLQGELRECELTPGMVQALSEFCEQVARASDEDPRVKAQAKQVATLLKSKLPAPSSRRPAAAAASTSRNE